MLVPSHLRSLQALELALRLGSLKAAADTLAITPAAVGQRIKALEDYLGIDLILRARSGLKPTAELQSALPHLGKAFSELSLAAEALDIQRVNEIHIAASQDWVELWLRPRLAKFRERYPNSLFCINGTGDAPIRLGQCDVEIDFGPSIENESVDVLFHDYLVPVSSPENKARVAKLRRKFRLEGFPLLHLDFYKDDPESLGWPRWIERYGHRKTAFERGIRFQQIAPALEAVRSDAGFVICGLALILDEVAAGELTLPFPLEQGAPTSFAFAATYKGVQGRKPIQRFRQWLAEEAAATRKALTELAT